MPLLWPPGSHPKTSSLLVRASMLSFSLPWQRGRRRCLAIMASLDRFSMDTQASAESYLSLSCQMEMHLEMPGKDGEKDVLWTGRTDYSYWYGNPENAKTNLIVVERGVYMLACPHSFRGPGKTSLAQSVSSLPSLLGGHLPFPLFPDRKSVV